MKRFAVRSLVLAFFVSMITPTLARAEGLDGWGHVSIGGGFRWVPNWWLKEKAEAAGSPVIPGVDGGPQGTASFGLGVMSWLAVSINLLFGYNGISLSLPDGQRADYASFTAAAMLGGRIGGTDVFFKGFMPYLEFQAGPTLAVLSGPGEAIPEKAILGLSAAAGATYRFSHQYGLTLEVRYLQARNSIPGISGINAGGVWFTAMFTIFFPPEIKRDLSLPSF